MESENIRRIIEHFYPDDTPLRQILLKHSIQVRDKALAILDMPECPVKDIDRQLVVDGAMLHDIGIKMCHAPDIFCCGDANYITHGISGGAMLREWGGADMELLARICERHTGSGITAAEIAAQRLPLPPIDMLPETPEEKLICLADKFFSKSGDMQEKSLSRIRCSMEKFGHPAVERFDELCRIFGVSGSC